MAGCSMRQDCQDGSHTRQTSFWYEV